MGLHKPNITIISTSITKCCTTIIVFTVVRIIAEGESMLQKKIMVLTIIIVIFHTVSHALFQGPQQMAILTFTTSVDKIYRNVEL